MKSKKKKYGTGTRVKGYLENPGMELAENQIDMAQAMLDSASNPWTQGMTALGNAAISYGVGQGGFKQITGEDNNLGSMLNGLLQAGGAMMATGGMVPVEVEGEETGILPNGAEVEFQGAKHEQGGIDLELPQGTEIFSDRIKVDGKTMAQRQKARSNQQSKLGKLLDNHGTDPLLTSTKERLDEVTSAEEEADMAIQEAFKTIMDTFGYGGRVKHYPGATVGPGPARNPGQPLPGAAYMELMDMMSGPVDPIYSQKPRLLQAPYSGSTAMLPSKDIAPLPSYTTPPLVGFPDSYEASGSVSTTGTKGPNLFQKAYSNLKELSPEVPQVTPGDLTSLAGQFMGTFGPMKNTLANRAGDSANPNYFEDFGEASLTTLEGSQDYLDEMEAAQLRDLTSSRATAQTRNRKGARGINTMRALDISTDLATDKARRDIKAGTAAQKMGIDQRIAQTQMARDDGQMRGEAEADTANRKDRDNFYSQRAGDMVNKSLGLQNIGRSFNQIKQREVVQNLLGTLSKYGITIDEKGNLVTKKTK